MGRLVRRYIRAFRAKVVDVLNVSGLLTLDRSGQDLLIKPSVDPAVNTKLLEIQNAAAASKFSVDLEGDVIGTTALIGGKDITNAIIAALAGKKIVYGNASITGTGDITATGLTTVEEAVVNVRNSGTALPTRTASITGISTNVVSVVVTEHASAANSVATAAATVAYIAIGT